MIVETIPEGNKRVVAESLPNMENGSGACSQMKQSSIMMELQMNFVSESERSPAVA